LIARNEKAEIIKKSALEYIAKKSNGSMRDAVTGLDIVLQTGNGKVTMEYVDIVSGGEIDRYDFCDLVDYIFQSDYRKALSVVKKKMSQGITGENLFNDILEYSHDFLLSKSINSTKFLSLSDDLDNRWNEILNKYKLEDFLILNSKIIDYSNAMWQSTRPDLLVDSCLIDTIKTCEKTS
jgi:DNA polymerase-3 subunit gamma/tau